MAVRLEQRYRGVRAPHKIKMAASGCTRECAEAQSKDVGVIATEKGWNLYVCGNGGMRPRHAELLASDLDDDTLIRLIDRFLMLYIRTADKLQRTAAWRENLEGGLDYLKDVIVHDRLGLGAELESQMQALVDAYECEWAATLKDEQALRRFRPLIHSDTPDPVPSVWQALCRLDALALDTGIAARAHGDQVAVFLTAAGPFAVDHVDPFCGAAVLARGIVGELQGHPVVASPMYKQHFRLDTGECLEDPAVRVRCWPLRVDADGVLSVAPPEPLPSPEAAHVPEPSL
jgi:nitrite reductase (NADH) large subunit